MQILHVSHKDSCAMHALPAAVNSADILTIEEVAKKLKLSRRSVYEATRRRRVDRMPAHPLGKGLRFYWPEVSAWFLRQHRPE